MVIINVKQYRAHQVLLLLIVGHLRHEVRKIILCPHMGHQDFPHCNSLADYVVATGHILLFQCQLGSLSVVDDRHVVTIDISWPRDGNTHHVELVLNAP